MQFDLTDLRLFAAVAESGSITAGAARAGLALPSASARIRGMEEALGTALLTRFRRGVRPTAAGETLLTHARLVLDQVERMRGELRAHARGGFRGRVRLLANTAALEAHLPDALGPWLASHPGIEVEIEERTSESVALGIAQGAGEIGILHSRAAPEGLETLPFRLDRLVLVLPAGHRLAERPAITFAEALEVEQVSLPAEAALTQHLERQAALIGQALRPRARLRGFGAVCRLVAAGAGAAILPEAAIPTELRLRAVPLTESWATRRLLLCTRGRAGLPAPARELLAQLAQG